MGEKERREHERENKKNHSNGVGRSNYFRLSQGHECKNKTADPETAGQNTTGNEATKNQDMGNDGENPEKTTSRMETISC